MDMSTINRVTGIGARARRGRPRLASRVSQLPACAVPTSLHDAVALEAMRRDVPVAEIVREALISHLKAAHAAQPN